MRAVRIPGGLGLVAVLVAIATAGCPQQSPGPAGVSPIRIKGGRPFLPGAGETATPAPLGSVKPSPSPSPHG